MALEGGSKRLHKFDPLKSDLSNRARITLPSFFSNFLFFFFCFHFFELHRILSLEYCGINNQWIKIFNVYTANCTYKHIRYFFSCYVFCRFNGTFSILFSTAEPRNVQQNHTQSILV